MKKLYSLSIALFVCTLVATTASADLLIADVDVGLDVSTNLTMYSDFWDSAPPLNDENPQDLDNNSLAAEENWLEALLGLEYNDPSVTLIDKIEFDPEGPTQLNDWAPGFAWDFVILKAGTISYAIEDTDLNNLLTFPDIAYIGDPNLYPYLPSGTSHLTFFSSSTAPVPEPATMLLFGTGLVGLAGLSRKIKR